MEAQESAVRWIEVRNGERRYSTVCGFEGMCPQREERESRKEKMREWLSGGVSPCQGEGRGFESRLVLFGKSRFTGLFLISCSISCCMTFSSGRVDFAGAGAGK